MEAQYLDLKMKFDMLQKENAHLRKENNQLKRMPLFVAVVVDMLGNGEIYLRQQGNNQEYLTHVDEDLYSTIKPGTKVAVNNSLSVVRVVGNIYDSRVRVMELEASPDVTFEQVGGLMAQIEEVREAVEYPLTKPEIFERIGVEPPKGILLHGSPGTGKTLIAKAVAHEARATFIRMSATLASSTSSSARVRSSFASSSRSPASGRPRSSSSTRSTRSGRSVRTTGHPARPRCSGRSCSSSAEMDGFNTRGDVRIMAATNRVDMLDPALLRPGRFDRIIEIPLPDSASRFELLRIHSCRMHLVGVRLDRIAEQNSEELRADFQAVCREAGMIAVRREALSVTHAGTSSPRSRRSGPIWIGDDRMYA